jgi:hypothetical protein
MTIKDILNRLSHRALGVGSILSVVLTTTPVVSSAEEGKAAPVAVQTPVTDSHLITSADYASDAKGKKTSDAEKNFRTAYDQLQERYYEAIAMKIAQKHGVDVKTPEGQRYLAEMEAVGRVAFASHLVAVARQNPAFMAELKQVDTYTALFGTVGTGDSLYLDAYYKASGSDQKIMSKSGEIAGKLEKERGLKTLSKLTVGSITNLDEVAKVDPASDIPSFGGTVLFDEGQTKAMQALAKALLTADMEATGNQADAADQAKRAAYMKKVVGSNKLFSGTLNEIFLAPKTPLPPQMNADQLRVLYIYTVASDPAKKDTLAKVVEGGVENNAVVATIRDWLGWTLQPVVELNAAMDAQKNDPSLEL